MNWRLKSQRATPALISEPTCAISVPPGTEGGRGAATAAAAARFWNVLEPFRDCCARLRRMDSPSQTAGKRHEEEKRFSVAAGRNFLAIAASFLPAQTSSVNPTDAPSVSSFSNGDAAPGVPSSGNGDAQRRQWPEPQECDLRRESTVPASFIDPYAARAKGFVVDQNPQRSNLIAAKTEAFQGSIRQPHHERVERGDQVRPRDIGTGARPPAPGRPRRSPRQTTDTRPGSRHLRRRPG